MKSIRYSDLLVSIRIVLVAIFAICVSFDSHIFHLVPGIIIISVVFLTDVFDGIVARKFDKPSKFGSFYDITGDRITEIGLLIPFTYLHIVSPVVLTYFVVKGFSIDYLRQVSFISEKKEPFKQLNNSIHSFLVGGRLFRASMGTAKTLLMFSAYIAIFYDSSRLKTLVLLCSIVTLAISILRSFPVYWEHFIPTKNST